MFRLRAALEDGKIIVSFIIYPFEDVFTGEPFQCLQRRNGFLFIQQNQYQFDIQEFHLYPCIFL